MSKYICLVFFLSAIALPLQAKKSDPENKPDWAKKDLSSFSDADMERLLDQWDEDEDPLPPDELPEHLRPSPNIDLSQIGSGTLDNEAILKLTKKGKTLMMFVNTEDGLTRQETEKITTVWQTSLWNNHMQADRFLIDDNRAIFMFKDGSMAWDAKNYLILQEKCKEVVIEGQTFEGPASKQKASPIGPDPKPLKTKSNEEL